jgi:2-oxoglutarate ferredoxin oxidoreductase subunit alpha
MPNVKAVFSIEMSAGQMVEDIKLGINGKKPVYFYGRTGGMIPSPNEILDYICDVLEVR